MRGLLHVEPKIFVFRSMASESNLLLLNGTNSDSEKDARTAAFDGISGFQTNTSVLFPIITELRVIKTEMELEALDYVARISSAAHRHVMREIKSGMREYQAEAEFLKYAYFHGGCRHVSYTCICGSGKSGAVLHYGHAGMFLGLSMFSHLLYFFSCVYHIHIFKIFSK